MIMSYRTIELRAIRVALSAVALLIISGCSHYEVDFDLTDGSFRPKGKSIAVISGTKEQTNVVLAKLVSDSLRKKSRYQVASMAEINQAVASYPQTIKGPYKSAYFVIDTDWDMGDRNKIASIQRSLGVDYLYVIWAPIAVQHNGGEVLSVPAVAQLFERPNTNVVAQTTLVVLVGDENNVYLKEGVDEIARQLAENTHMASGAKK